MTRLELNDDAGCARLIREFVMRDYESFLQIKDAFVAHTPQGETDTDSKNFGKLLATIFVFNELEKLAKEPKPKKQTESESNKQDADLET